MRDGIVLGNIRSSVGDYKRTYSRLDFGCIEYISRTFQKMYILLVLKVMLVAFDMLLPNRMSTYSSRFLLF